MKNQRVYLAKSDLARGLDFEYVKSNLLRIPGIEIMEFGGGINPSECSCTVYVHDNTKDVVDELELAINKNVFNDSIDSNELFIYSGNSESNSNDFEETTPTCVRAKGIDIHNEDEWDNYGTLELGDEFTTYALLVEVSSAMGLSNVLSFQKNSRHYKPESKYAMPPIPSMEQRRSNGTTRLEDNQEFYQEDRQQYSPVKSFNKSTEKSVRLKKKRRL